MFVIKYVFEIEYSFVHKSDIVDFAYYERHFKTRCIYPHERLLKKSEINNNKKKNYKKEYLMLKLKYVFLKCWYNIIKLSYLLLVIIK